MPHEITIGVEVVGSDDDGNEVRETSSKTHLIMSADEIDLVHAADVVEWLNETLEEVAEVVPKLVHAGDSDYLRSVEWQSNDPCLIEKLNEALEQTEFYVKLEEEEPFNRTRCRIYRLNGTQAEAKQSGKHATALLGLLMAAGILGTITWLVMSFLGVI